MAKTGIRPTEAELDILQILWKHGPSTVKQVNELINERRESGYTTTLKIMQIMAEKNYCSREMDGKTHIYSALVKEHHVKKSAVKELVDEVFEGAAMELVIQTLGHYKATDKELKELKHLIRELKKTQQSK